jgi:hypothetical protein
LTNSKAIYYNLTPLAIKPTFLSFDDIAERWF